MADVNLPSINELSQMQFLPAAQYQMARNNANLANQFQQQNLSQGDANLQATLLKNSFDEKNNPITLQGNQGLADTRTAEGILKGIDAKQRQALAPEEQEAKRAKFIKDKSDADLADFMTRVERDMMDPNTSPERREAAKEAYARSTKEMHERWKAKDTQANTKITADAHIRGAEIAADASKYGADARERSAAKTAANRQKNNLTVQERIMAAKTPDAQAAIYDGAAEQAQLDGDDTMYEAYKQKAAYARAVSVQNRTATAGVQQGGKLDTSTAANTGVIQNQPNPVQTPTAPGMPRRNSQMERQVPQGVQQDRNADALGVMARELATALANKDMVTAERLQREMAGQIRGTNPSYSGGLSTTAPKPAAPAPQAPAGRVIIYKDGKAVGSVPQAQADEAVKQGYSLK